MNRKSASKKRVSNLTRKRKVTKARASVTKKNSTVSKSERFNRLRKFTSSMGISDSQLTVAMSGETDMSKILSKLHIITPGEGAVKARAKFTGDGLYDRAPEPYHGRQLGDVDKFSDFRTENEPVTFRPVLRRMDGGGRQMIPRVNMNVRNRMKQRELGSRVAEIQAAQPRIVGEPYRFPNTDFDYDLIGAIQSSIANYKKKKNMFNVDGSPAVYSQLTNQL